MAIPFPRSIGRVFHYQQAPNTQPVATRIPTGQERVELMTGGRGWIQDGEMWKEVRAGDLLWNASGDSTIGRSDPEDPYRCLAVTFEVDSPEGLGVPRFSHWPEPDQIAVLVEECHWLAAEENFDRVLWCHYLFTRLRVQVELHQRRERHERLPDPIRRVLEQMDRNYGKKWSVAELARVAGWSPAHLQEEFRRRVGTSPHQWLLQRRLRGVRERLLSTPDPVKRIAVESGFADSASLAHVFRARFGISAKAFRERYLRVVER
jgi:AraC-like DNA-binding protein